MLARVPPIDWKKRLRNLGIVRTRKARKGPALTSSLRTSSSALGRQGEDLAARFLEGRGVRILDRNVRRDGSELDVVGIDGGALVFVEVKRRRNGRLGAPAEAVTSWKRRRIVSGARHWLAENQGLGKREIRFDVVTIVDEPGEGEAGEDESGRIDWIQGAFDATFS